MIVEGIEVIGCKYPFCLKTKLKVSYRNYSTYVTYFLARYLIHNESMFFLWHFLEGGTVFSVSDDLVEKSQSCVTIHDLDALALTLLVDFSYTGEQF